MNDQLDVIATVLCGKPLGMPANECLENKAVAKRLCRNYHKCRITDKSGEQLAYITHLHDKNSFLEACAGSGKTEVVGLKAAYEIKKWTSNCSGIAILTFTNNAADVIEERISQATKMGYPHFVGTFDSWLHRYIANPFAHLITKYKGKNGDRSIRVVDNRSEAGFLSAFQTKYAYFSTPPIKANEFSFNMADGSFIFSSSNENLDRIRSQSILEEWRKDELSQTKERFWAAGFATYQDVEYICHEILKRKYAAEVISKRFPLILIDECQDLAWPQIQILEKLLLEGSHIHLIGDLNQAIYSFRKVNPRDVEDFVLRHKFSTLKLTRNFRSLQPIVDLSSKIVNQSNIEGVKPEDSKPVCLCYEYKKAKIQDLPNRFIEFLKNGNFEIEKCAILTRNNNTVTKLRPGIKSDLKSPTLLPIAIQIWRLKSPTPGQLSEALSAVGKFLSIYYFHSQSNNHQSQYCPDEVNSKVSWRLFLADVLEGCCQDKDLSNLELIWADWAKYFRSRFHSIMANATTKYEIRLALDNVKDYRAPVGKGNKSLSKEQVKKTIETVLENPTGPIRITNFHQVKGETLDAAMIVSSPTNQGKSEGYWKNWLIDYKSENARFAYVASTRPRSLLIWAVPENLTTQDIASLKNLGFELISDL